MAECSVNNIGGGGGSDVCTAARDKVLAGFKAITKDSNDEPVEGLIQSMPGQTVTPASYAQTVNCLGKYMTGNIIVAAKQGTIFTMRSKSQRFSLGYMPSLAMVFGRTEDYAGTNGGMNIMTDAVSFGNSGTINVPSRKCVSAGESRGSYTSSSISISVVFDSTGLTATCNTSATAAYLFWIMVF